MREQKINGMSTPTIRGSRHASIQNSDLKEKEKTGGGRQYKESFVAPPRTHGTFPKKKGCMAVNRKKNVDPLKEAQKSV